ncbi:MAG: nucleotide exchange factor GrpE [Planctomycetota bacterium]|nr:nucleotide exchange factor GrpE [Planctomycetota bacterium]
MIDESHEERMLERFRDWLRAVRDEREPLLEQNDEQDSSDDESATPEFGLIRLVEEFTSLRHDLKLQTRGARALEDEARNVLGGLQQAIEVFQTPPREPAPRESTPAPNAGKGLAMALVELDEALDRGRQQIEKIRQRLPMEQPESLSTRVDVLYSQLSGFQRWNARRYHAAVQKLLQDEPRDEAQKTLQAMLDGYRLIHNRLSRALASEGISRLDAVGRPVDPETMIVVEVVDAEGVRGGVVVDELRRGYIWNGRLLRSAEVRASRILED